MPKYKILIGRFPYGNEEDSRCVDWLMKAAVQLATDPRFELSVAKISDTPITMTRNQMIEHALRRAVDFLLLIDNDIEPDCELGVDPLAKPFLKSSLDFMLAPGQAPCVVAAPYCGPPPMENVYVFQWGNKMSEDPDGNGSVDQFSREHAAMMTGITEVAALPTGLMLLDMRVFEGMKGPYTYYEWKGDGDPCPHCGVRTPGPQSEKSSTEDVTLTRDLALAGRKQYCNWDAWAAHIKKKRVLKPRPWTTDIVAERMRGAIVRGVHAGDRITQVRPSGRFAADIAAAEARGPAAPGATFATPETPIIMAPYFGRPLDLAARTSMGGDQVQAVQPAPLPTPDGLRTLDSPGPGGPVTMADVMGLV